MTNFLDQTKAELRALEEELEADPRYLKAKALREVIRLYGGPASEPESAESRPTFVPRPKPVQRPRPVDSHRVAILDAVREVLIALNQPYPVKTAEIFDLLPDEIVQSIPGKEPKSNLSAMIHNSKRFRSHGREGWMLLESDIPNAGHNVRASSVAADMEELGLS